MKKKRNKYGRRSTVNSKKKKAWPILLTVVVFLAVTFVVAVSVGAYLREKAEDIKTTPKYELGSNSPSKSDEVSGVYAPCLGRGESPSRLLADGYKDISVALNDKNGEMYFASSLWDEISGESVGGDDLSKFCDSVHEKGGRVCAYFYSTAFECEDDNLRRVKKSYEISLMCEAMSMGVDDVLILGVDVSGENYVEVVQFLCEIDAFAQDCSVGIAVNAGVFLLTEDEIYIAGALLGASDYVSLDLRGLSFESSDATGNKDELEKKMLSEYLFNMKYYLSAYSARLVFSEQNKEFFSLSRELGYGNVQVVCE